MKKKTKKKEQIEEVFVRATVDAGKRYSHVEYLEALLAVGAKEKNLRKAAFEFAMDNILHLTKRLNKSEVKEVEKRLKKEFKEII